ncbi:MAG: GGDEF domain-containing protein [Methylococcaceae bacterium]|nr:GGDEF domain-containing protein [Methylococcaceae bacterium]
MHFNLEILSRLWSVYDFKDPEIKSFAQQQLMLETRQGLKLMSTLLIFLILVAMLLFRQLGQMDSYGINYFWVMALAAHINVSARVVKDVATLHALGMTLLVISATAYVFIAHQTGSFSPLLLANIVLLFMIIPMVPWGLREAFFVILAIYSLLTLSTYSVSNRFDEETIKVLQFFLLAAGSTSLLLVIRSVLIRKKELVSHFDLQKAHAELYTLSNIDPLTSAWNRRYTDTAVSNLISCHVNTYNDLHFIIFDIDRFKLLNDSFGHDFGDRVLILLSKTIQAAVDKQGELIRIGGDEFILLLVGFDPDVFMQDITQEIKALINQEQEDAYFDLSWGYVTLPLAVIGNSESVYQKADLALYAHKQLNRKHSNLQG